ncbi:MFS transporter [Verrucosispora sp. TAA-831]|uniref:MFS transporter n=1 Tax=Verrucosispora sp. TAA-831 TaxID=3422227 RepID=UPI003D6FD967
MATETGRQHACAAVVRLPVKLRGGLTLDPVEAALSVPGSRAGTAPGGAAGPVDGGNVKVTGGRAAVPGAYWAWLGGTAVSLVGVQALAFAMAFVAAGYGGQFTALVLTAINLPRALLLMAGGAVADRVGPWRVMIISDAAMVVVTLSLALAAWSSTDPRLPLLLAALATGVVDAFHLPSSGSMPRRLVSPAALARAMSARQLAGQLALFAGPVLGGLLLAPVGLAGAALVNAATFAVMLSILVTLRRGRHRVPDAAPASDPASAPVWRAALDGLRVAAGHPALRPALLLTGAAAGFLLPVSSLLLPLLARERAWPGPLTGTVVAAVAAGTVVVAVAVLARGASSRPGATAVGGLLTAAAGTSAVAMGGTPIWSVAAAATVGVGSGLFATHVGPLILAAGPATHLARVQSVLVLVQSLPLLLTTALLGAVAEIAAAPTVLYGCAGALAASAVAALASPVLRA